jgi:hypothetical protein
MNRIRSLAAQIGGVAILGCLGLLLATTAVRADGHGGGDWHGGDWHGGGWHGGGWHGGGWGWHGGRWSCCWRGGVFIGVAPPVYLPPPVYYPPPYYAAPYGYVVPGY